MTAAGVSAGIDMALVLAALIAGDAVAKAIQIILELMQFHAPTARAGDRHAPPNTLGIRRIAFAVDDIDAAVAGLQARGTELVGAVERYEDAYRLCYVRGPEGIIVMLAEQLSLGRSWRESLPEMPRVARDGA